MTVYEKTKSVYPDLTDNVFAVFVLLQNDGDGRGDYIVAWTHPTLPKPDIT